MKIFAELLYFQCRKQSIMEVRLNRSRLTAADFSSKIHFFFLFGASLRVFSPLYFVLRMYSSFCVSRHSVVSGIFYFFLLFIFSFFNLILQVVFLHLTFSQSKRFEFIRHDHFFKIQFLHPWRNTDQTK